jgi:hypothetical protein
MSENKNAKTPTDDGQVAHVYLFEKTGRPMVAWDNAKDIKLGDRLYVAPKQWVGLTDDEIDAAWRSVDYTVAYEQFRIDVARAVEQRLKKRNT